MKKCVKFASVISLVLVSGSAFAQSNSVNSSLAAVIAHTDAQLAPVLAGALEQLQPVTFPESAVSRAVPHSVQLQDITEKCTQAGEVVSAYPAVYKMIHSEENSRIIKVFRFLNKKGAERRVEVYFTGGDWMQYGLTYLVINSGQNKDQVNAYFITDLSTPDREGGAVAPRVDPFDAHRLSDFIAADFLDANGSVKAAFDSVASVSVPAK